MDLKRNVLEKILENIDDSTETDSLSEDSKIIDITCKQLHPSAANKVTISCIDYTDLQFPMDDI